MDPTKMKRAWSAKNKNKKRERERERERELLISHNIQATFGDLEISKLVNRVR